MSCSVSIKSASLYMQPGLVLFCMKRNLKVTVCFLISHQANATSPNTVDDD